MRDLFAGVVALVLLFVAASLATTLTMFRKRRMQTRAAEGARGRRIIAEVPADDDLVYVSEDDDCLYYGDQAIAKEAIAVVRVLINGSPIVGFVSPRWEAAAAQAQPTSLEDRPEGIARDRWDVVIETVNGHIVVECGAVRERVSQELARKIFDAVKAAIERDC